MVGGGHEDKLEVAKLGAMSSIAGEVLRESCGTLGFAGRCLDTMLSSTLDEFTCENEGCECEGKLEVDETFEDRLPAINIEVNFEGFEGAEGSEGSEDFVSTLDVEGAESSLGSDVE